MAGYVRFDEGALDALFDSPSGEVAKDLKRRSTQVTRAAKRACPVDTGRLRSSITDEVGADAGGLVARIGTNVNYAIFVELGTSRMSARPYLRPALKAGQR